MYAAEACVIVGVTAEVAVRQPYNLVSGLGILVLVGIGVVFSTARSKVHTYVFVCCQWMKCSELRIPWSSFRTV